MIQYDVYKSPFSKEEEPDHYHAQTVSKGVITYDHILYSREKVRATAASIFPRPGASTRVHTRHIPTDEIIS